MNRPNEIKGDLRGKIPGSAVLQTVSTFVLSKLLERRRKRIDVPDDKGMYF